MNMLIYLIGQSCFPQPRPFGRSHHFPHISMPYYPALHYSQVGAHHCVGTPNHMNCNYIVDHEVFLAFPYPGKVWVEPLSNKIKCACVQAKASDWFTRKTHTLIQLLMWDATWHSYAWPVSWQTLLVTHTKLQTVIHSLPTWPPWHTCANKHTHIPLNQITLCFFSPFPALSFHPCFSCKVCDLSHSSFLFSLCYSFLISLFQTHRREKKRTHRTHTRSHRTTAAQTLAGNRWRKISHLLCAWALHTGLLLRSFFEIYQNSLSHVSIQWLAFKPI